MSRVLVTGMSGTGKSTLIEELRRRGLHAVDTDYDGWQLPDGRWDEPRMLRLLSTHRELVVSGTVENQGAFYVHFSHIMLLSAPLEVLTHRVATRSNNPYGRTQTQRNDIARYVESVEPLLRRDATIELDGRRSVKDLADAVELLVKGC